MIDRPVIEFGECLLDSPRFRIQLHQNEVNLEELESKVERVSKNCGVMTELGRQYLNQQVCCRQQREIRIIAGYYQYSTIRQI